MRPCLNGSQIWTAGFRAPRSTAHMGFRSPPRLSTFKRGGGGGVRNRGCTSSTARSKMPGSTARRVIPDPPPPRLSTFKRRGGGSGIEAHLSDGQDQSARINDAQAIPDILSHSAFNQRGPPPFVVSSCHLFST
jgi:hypothetical protein